MNPLNHDHCLVPLRYCIGNRVTVFTCNKIIIQGVLIGMDNRQNLKLFRGEIIFDVGVSDRRRFHRINVRGKDVVCYDPGHPTSRQPPNLRARWHAAPNSSLRGLNEMALLPGVPMAKALGGTNLTHPERALDDVSMDDSMEMNQQCFEGQIVDRGCEEDIPVYDFQAEEWGTVSTYGDENALGDVYPKSRRFHSCVKIPDSSQLVIIGGFNGCEILDDCWLFNLDTLRWKKIFTLKLPFPTYFHASSITPAGKLYNFGGICEVGRRTHRTSDILSAWVCIPKLKEMCWEAILHYDFLNKPNRAEVLADLPVEFRSRVTNQAANCEEGNVESGDYNCADHSIYECAYPGDIQKFHAVSSASELAPLCRNLHDYLRCIDNYTRKCLQPPQRSHFNRLFSGTSMIIHEICSEGHYQTEFLKHAVCMKQLNDEFDTCAKTYHSKIEIIEQNPQIGQSICCPLREYMSCLNEVVNVRCGEVTANFSLGFNERLFHAILTTHCSTEETDCSTNGVHWTVPSLFIIVFLASASTSLTNFRSR